MRTIKAYTSYRDYDKTHFYRNFEIVDYAPEKGDMFRGEEVKDVSTVPLDVEQGRDEVYDYDYFRVETTFNGEYNPEEDENNVFWIAVEKEEEEEEMSEEESEYWQEVHRIEYKSERKWEVEKLAELSEEEKKSLAEKLKREPRSTDWREFKDIKIRLGLSWNELRRVAGLC